MDDSIGCSRHLNTAKAPSETAPDAKGLRRHLHDPSLEPHLTLLIVLFPEDPTTKAVHGLIEELREELVTGTHDVSGEIIVEPIDQAVDEGLGRFHIFIDDHINTLENLPTHTKSTHTKQLSDSRRIQARTRFRRMHRCTS